MLDGTRLQHLACNDTKDQAGRWSGNEKTTAVGTCHSILILPLPKGVGDGHPAEQWPDCSARIIVVVDGVLASLLAKWLQS